MSSNPRIYMDYGVGSLEQQTRAIYVRLYGCRPKSVSAGLGCCLRTPALSVTHSAAEAAYAACGDI